MTSDDFNGELQRRGLSQRRAARILGLHWVSINRYARGRAEITDERAALIRMRLAEFDNGWRS